MPDASGRLTPEEEMALRLRQSATMPAATRAAMQAPMQTASREELQERAAQDFRGKERQIKSQRAYADMLRGQGAPQGKTVGPSNLYVAPNWGEQLASVGGQLLGGYMSGKANKADTDLDESRLSKAKAALELEQMQKDQIRQDALDEKARLQGNFEAQQAALAEERRLTRETRERADAEKKQSKIAANNAKVLDEGADEMNAELERKREMQKEMKENYKESIDKAKERAEGGDLTEAQSKHKFQAEMLDAAITDIEDVLATGYNTGGVGALKNKLTGMSDLTRWATSAEGLKFKSAANTAKEQILRAATGAAAPETENKEYIETLVPRVGESKEVVEYKLTKMKEAQALLAELGGDRWNESISRSRATYNPPSQGGDSSSRRQQRAEQAQQRRDSGKVMQSLTDEEEEIYKQFPHLRPGA